MKNLGTIPSNPDGSSNGIGINNHDDVVGAADAPLGPDPTYIGTYAFLYSHGKMQDLNTLIPADSGWILANGNSINDRGAIAGTGLLNNFGTHAFLLTPVDEDSDVNESQKAKDRCRNEQKHPQ